MQDRINYSCKCAIQHINIHTARNMAFRIFCNRPDIQTLHIWIIYHIGEFTDRQSLKISTFLLAGKE